MRGLGVDTRCLTKKIREKGTMLGKLVVDGTPAANIPFDNPDERNQVKEVSMKVNARSRHCPGPWHWLQEWGWSLGTALCLPALKLLERVKCRGQITPWGQ